MDTIEIIYKLGTKLTKTTVTGYLGAVEQVAEETLSNYHQSPVEIIRIRVKG